MIDVLLRVHKVKPSDSWQRVLTYKNEKHLKESVEQLSNCEDVVKVEIILKPDIKEHFNAKQ